MGPNNLGTSIDTVGDAKISSQTTNFTLEEITDRKMGLIQCCCASGCGTVNFDDIA
ncbi:hypothetical protein KBD33_05670 [Candidatus Gracilibacteria bacterium]|nr:hypothetical protein [Candidatus Gracilibacteria bacterium]